MLLDNLAIIWTLRFGSVIRKLFQNIKKCNNDDKEREDLVFVDKTKLLLSTQDGYDALGSMESGKIIKAFSDFRLDLIYTRL